MIKKSIFIIIFLTQMQFIYSQNEMHQKSDSIIHVEDKEYYYHIVKQGETVYSISKNYGIRIDSLLSNNKKIINNHIVVGEALIIPSYRHVYDFIEYITEKKESMVDIANRFQIPLKELKERNPRLSNNVAKNTVVFIPIQRKAPDIFSEQEKSSTQKETEFSLDSIKMKSLTCIGEWDTKKKYTVALILPLAANKLPANILSNIKKQEYKSLNSNVFKYIPFYHGVILALDSLTEKGLNICLNVYDINNNIQMEELLEKSEMHTTDLIIGIIYAETFKKIADFSEQYNIPLINVTSPRNDILQGHINIAKIVPDDRAISHAAQQILPDNENINILIIKKNETVYNGSIEKLKTLYPHYREFLSEGKNMSGAVSSLDSHKPNFVFMFSENTTEILDLMRIFDEKRKQYDITLVGYPNWNNIEKLDYHYAHNLKLHFIVSQIINYNEQRIKDFVSIFRDRFNSDPNMLAFQGYDIAYNFLSAIGMFGQNCFECFNHIPHHFLSTGDIILNNTPGNGYNNQYWNIYTIQDYEIIRVP